MKIPFLQKRTLDPIERFSEIVFGLIMVLSFTCALSVAEVGREDVRIMLIGAIGCNLAWGIIDAAFYLIARMAEQGHQAEMLRRMQRATTREQAHAAILDALPPKIAEAMPPEALERVAGHLQGLSAPPERPKLTGADWRGAFGVFLLVFLSTFPVVVPFMVIHDARLALHLSNGIAIALLFGAGRMLAVYAGLRPVATGLAMVGVGMLLVALTIALGG